MIWENNEDIRLLTVLNSRRSVQEALNACREERRPYVVVTNTMRDILSLNRILVPVTMLEEEVYKAEICTYLARKTGARLILLQPHDVGSHARINIQKIVTRIRSVSEATGSPLSYEIVQGRKDSFSLYKESCERQADFGHQLLVLTASREYGLDDILFGPPERYVIRHSLVPVMLVNPRADLFSLCD